MAEVLKEELYANGITGINSVEDRKLIFRNVFFGSLAVLSVGVAALGAGWSIPALAAISIMATIGAATTATLAGYKYLHAEDNFDKAITRRAEEIENLTLDAKAVSKGLRNSMARSHGNVNKFLAAQEEDMAEDALLKPSLGQMQSHNSAQIADMVRNTVKGHKFVLPKDLDNESSESKAPKAGGGGPQPNFQDILKKKMGNPDKGGGRGLG